jgi:hypothetical protein
MHSSQAESSGWIVEIINISNRKRDSGQWGNREDDDMGGNQSVVFGKQAGIYITLEYLMGITKGGI